MQQLSELRAEIWRTRDDLERIKSRTSSIDRFHRSTPVSATRYVREDEVAREQHFRGTPVSPRSTHTDREPLGEKKRGDEGASVLTSLSGSERGAEATLSSLKVDGESFKNWTDEAASIAVKLIEEVKKLRWERESWLEREARGTRDCEELLSRVEGLEKRLKEADADNRSLRDEVIRLRDAERDQARVADRAREEVRAADQETESLRAQMAVTEGKVGSFAKSRRGDALANSLKEELRREKAEVDALQRQLDNAKAASAKHMRERRAWQESRGKLDHLRLMWGKQLKKVAKKMRSLSKENTSLRGQRKQEVKRMKMDWEQSSESAKKATAATAAATRAIENILREELTKATHQQASHQQDMLLPPPANRQHGGDVEDGRVTSSGTANAAAAAAAAAAANVLRGFLVGGGICKNEPARGEEHGGLTGVGDRCRNLGNNEELEAELEQVKVEARLARIAVQQERLKCEDASREKEEAVRQLHQLTEAARRAVGRRDTRLRSSRLETELVWNALTQAVR